MLSWADRAVVDRDPYVPGLRLLLDDAVLSEWVTHSLGVEVRVVPSRVRYKPGTSCVLAFELHRPGHRPVPCIARAYSAEAAAKVDKSVRHVPRHDVVLVAEAERVAVTTIAGDRHLPGPLRLFAGGEERVRLLRRLLPHRLDLHSASIRTIRHNPERRWVGVLEGSAERVVLRGFRAGAAEGPLKGYGALEDGTPLTPSVLGRSRKHAMIAVSWAEGMALDVTGPTQVFGAAGSALAQLHSRRPLRRLGGVPASAHAERLRETQAQVLALLPRLRDVVADTVTDLLAGQPGVPHEPVMLHGDFSADQVVVDGAGAVTLIDLDSACLGDAAQDLGSLWAAALVDAQTRGVCSDSRIEAALDGYAAVRPLPTSETIAWYRDAFVLRLAAEAFRSRRTDWSEQMVRLVELARDGGAP